MIFYQKALDAKLLHLDEIKKCPDVLFRVLERNLKSKFLLSEQNRIWLGGGCTNYIVTTDSNKFFLKVKHKDVSVESILEEESGFIEESCLLHEKKMLEKAYKAGASVPKIVFFDEEQGFQFLATEYIQKSFDEALNAANLETILKIWTDLESNVRLLFEAGIVHSDIHEFNLRVKDKKIILIDFEEARELRQNCIFENSLDYVGKNSKSTLGEFPLANEQDYSVKINSLLRIRQLLKKYIVPKVREYIKECNYDSSNGICCALDHGNSELTYQSIQTEWFSVKGQREMKDKRPKLIWSIMQLLGVSQDYTFVDVGSNNGLFCREISKLSEGKIQCIGLEGFHKFNVLADSLAILEECNNIKYYDFICGQNELNNLKINHPCFMTICSVWHHIKNKDIFIEQMRKMDIRFIFLEMPVQKECYEGRSWQDAVNNIKKALDFDCDVFLGNSNDYNRPLVLLSKNIIDNKLERELVNTAFKFNIHLWGVL